MPRTGLGKIAELVPATGRRKFAGERISLNDIYPSMSGVTLVTFALRQEGYAFARKLAQRRIKGGLVFGRLGASEIVVCWLGIGVQYVDSFARVIAESEARLIINSGFAGAVRSLLEAGDFVLANNYSSQEPVEKLRTSKLFAARGKLVSVKEIAGPETKKRLSLEKNVLAVDMECDRAAMICRNFSVPHVTAKMISDRSDETVPALFAGGKFRGPDDVFDAIQFSARMLVLREKLASRLTQLVPEAG
jgi:nucleoside phosphorylase